MLKLNLASWDRIARIVIALAFFVLIATGTVTGTWGIILGILGVVFFLTAAIGFCPIYWVLHLRTNKA